MSSERKELLIGSIRIVNESPFRTYTMVRALEIKNNYSNSQMYLIVSLDGGAPIMKEVSEGFLKGTVSLCTRELIEFFGSNANMFAWESPDLQRAGLLYLSTLSNISTIDLMHLSYERDPKLTFTIIHVTPGTINQGSNMYAIQYTEVYYNVEIEAVVQMDTVIMLAATYLKRELVFTSTDPKVVGQKKAITNFSTQTFEYKAGP